MAAAEAEDGDDAWEARCNGALAVIRLLQRYGTSPTPLAVATLWLQRAIAASVQRPAAGQQPRRYR